MGGSWERVRSDRKSRIVNRWAPATETVRDLRLKNNLGSAILVLDGANLRRLSGGLGLRSPGIPAPGTRDPRSSWWEVGNVLFDSFAIQEVPGEIIRSSNPVTHLKDHYLENGRGA